MTFPNPSAPRKVEKLSDHEIETIMRDLRVDLNAWLEGFKNQVDKDDFGTAINSLNLYNYFSDRVADALLESRGQIPLLVEILYREYLIKTVDLFPVPEAGEKYLKFVLFRIAQNLASKASNEINQK